MISFKPTHTGVNLEEGFETFLAINPHRLPSYFLSQEQHKKIKRLGRKDLRAFKWFQDLQDLAYRRETTDDDQG